MRFLEHAQALRSPDARALGTRQVERRGHLLRATGAERTLVEGFRRPALVGGVEQLVLSAAGFPTLDLELLEHVLSEYGEHVLQAAVGWFLERFQESFHVPESFLRELEARGPSTPRYLLRGRRGGALASRWNLILPDEMLQLEERGER